MMLVRKASTFGDLDSSIMLLFGEMLLLAPSGRSNMHHKHVGMYRQPLMMMSPFNGM